VVVVIEEGERVIGLLVDAVSDIITETEEMRQVPPETGSAASREYVAGLLMRGKQIISVLSIPAIMPKDTSIEAALEAV
jgi:purine-binding chemotaxis protein CheW